MDKNNFFGKIKAYIKDMDEETWKNYIFFMFFMLVFILRNLGIYKLSDNSIIAFTFGTLVLSFGDWVEEIFAKRVIYFIGIFIYFGISNCEIITRWIDNVFPAESLLIMSIISLFGSMQLNGFRTRREELRVKGIIQEHNKTIMEYKDTTSMFCKGIDDIENGTRRVLDLNKQLLQIALEEGSYNKEDFKLIVDKAIKQNELIIEYLETINNAGKVVSDNVNKIGDLQMKINVQ